MARVVEVGLLSLRLLLNPTSRWAHAEINKPRGRCNRLFDSTALVGRLRLQTLELTCFSTYSKMVYKKELGCC